MAITTHTFIYLYFRIPLLVLLYAHASNAQTTIWSENFDGYADGTTTGVNNNVLPATVDWTSGGCTTCASNTSDWWEVRSGVMEARDVNNEYCSWTSEVIDISTFVNIQFSIDVSEAGDHEGPYLGTDDCIDVSNEDFVDVEYQIDGGGWILISNYLGWCGLYNSCGHHTFYGDDNSSGDCRTSDVDWESVNLVQTGLTGSTLQIRLSAVNSSGTEYIRFDNILVQGTGTLPITLLSFEAKMHDNWVNLNWSTATELNNDFFTVERSIDGELWSPILNVMGAGNSSSQINYNCIDQSPLMGVSYYRLKQTDYDGSSSYSQTKTVTVSTDIDLNIFPNPANDYINFQGKNLEGAKIKILNNIGQTILTIDNISGETTISVAHLSRGMYTVHIYKNGAYSVQKLMKN